MTTKTMDKVYKKIEKYLHEQFPHKMILKASRKEIVPELEEIYGFMSMAISVYPINGKIYYKLIKRK